MKRFKQAYEIVDKLFEIRQHVIKSKHKDAVELRKNVDEEIIAFVSKIRTVKQNAEIVEKGIIQDEIGRLLEHIRLKNTLHTRNDTVDKKSMHKVICISIAVCVIVILSITLLIAVHNKNQANAEVRLLNWV